MLATKRNHLTVAQTAEYCGLSVPTLQRYRAAGNGPRFIRFPHKILYDLRDVDEWLAAHKFRSIKEAARPRRRRSPDRGGGGQ
jgi:predicted DNA-binding transcriptional regulator AlpA